ncbi:hypothetical protein RHOER0001_1660 [Rhodococcus erythropolis SK121]|nr:hypothetical protein RHOER0001_1660 [Rhodococcus erythropolis SK121]
MPGTLLGSSLLLQAVKPKAAIATTGATTRQDIRRVLLGAIEPLL